MFFLGILFLAWAFETKTAKAQINIGVGSKFQDIEFISVQATNVNTELLRKDRVFLVAFWKTSCGECKEQAKFLSEFYNKRSKERNFEAIAILYKEEDEDFNFSKALSFVQEAHISFPVFYDGDDVTKNIYQVRTFPYLIIVDTEGIIKFQLRNITEVTETPLIKKIDLILNKGVIFEGKEFKVKEIKTGREKKKERQKNK